MWMNGFISRKKEVNRKIKISHESIIQYFTAAPVYYLLTSLRITKMNTCAVPSSFILIGKCKISVSASLFNST